MVVIPRRHERHYSGANRILCTLNVHLEHGDRHKWGPVSVLAPYVCHRMKLER